MGLCSSHCSALRKRIFNKKPQDTSQFDDYTNDMPDKLIFLSHCVASEGEVAKEVATFIEEIEVS